MTRDLERGISGASSPSVNEAIFGCWEENPLSRVRKPPSPSHALFPHHQQTVWKSCRHVAHFGLVSLTAELKINSVFVN